MNYEEPKQDTKQEKHLAVAVDMADNICEQSPEYQNVMVKHIYSIVKERRQQMIEDGEKNVAWLKDTIQQL